MKKLFLVLLLIFFIPVKPVFAHLAGQPPYFKVDGVYSDLYPVLSNSVEDFALPQDLAKGTFLVGKSINFEFDIPKMPVPPEIVDQTTFDWDFGDGTKGSGLKNLHTYKTAGSYIMTINAKFKGQPDVIIQSTLINILPTTSYQLPKSVIKINGQTSSDPIKDILHYKFDNPLTLDGSDSTGQIVSYYWDLGDQSSSSDKKLTHSYNTDRYDALPILRVKDKNGFIADSFVQVINEQGGTVINNKLSPQKNNLVILVIAGLSFVVLIGIGIFFIKGKKKK